MQAAGSVSDRIGFSGHPASYWVATAAPAPVLTTLRGEKQFDVAIIGGGFTGLSAAYHLSKTGIGCAILEAADVGWGASGRNAGMLPPRYKKGFASVAGRYGDAVTRRLYQIIHEAIDTVESIVGDCAIDCGFGRVGQLTAAHSRRHLAGLQADAEWMRAQMADRTVRILNRTEVIDEVGGGKHIGGWLDPRGAGIHPLNYVRGLAAELDRRGVPIFVRSPVTGLIDDTDGIRLETSDGSVRARQVIIATNAYTDITGFAPHGLDRHIVPVTTSIICTKPLPEDLASKVLPGRRVVADTKHIMNYYRIMPDNSVVFGGRGDITGRSDDPQVYALLERQLAETFSQIADVEIVHRWSGKVAITLDDFPHIGRLSPRLSYALGYGGRGVALSNVLGKFLAKLVRNEAINAGPMETNRFGAIPLHAFRIPGMRIVAGWYRLLDARASYLERRPADNVAS